MLPKYIDDFTNYLKNNGVDIIESGRVDDIDSDDSQSTLTYYKDGEQHTLQSKYVIVAPGRTGAGWLQELLDRHKIPYFSQSIEIGVRVEVRKEVLQSITDVIYDPTIFIKTKTYGDEIRTFCTNPGGYVAKENYYG